MRENLQISTQILDPFSLLLWFLVGFAKNAHMHACTLDETEIGHPLFSPITLYTSRESTTRFTFLERYFQYKQHLKYIFGSIYYPFREI